MRDPSNHIFEHTPDSLAQWCAAHGWPTFRARQILDWVYFKNIIDPALMSNLAPDHRAALAREMTFCSGPTLAHQTASDGTQKLLIQWTDDSPEPNDQASPLPVINTLPHSDPASQTECVLIPADGEKRHRNTGCISSQVGCAVGCRFCASGMSGLDGNLSAGRIVEQVWRLAQLPTVQRVTNVVFMGMGEPLANFTPVISAIRTIAAPWGLGVSARRITISTVGIHKAIERLARELDLPVTLALSLHAPNDELRRQLIPWANYTSIDQLLACCNTWFDKTGREITLEYVLLGGVNDQPEHAHQLADVAKKLRANVNLIRYNEVVGIEFRRPATADVHRFHDILSEHHINAHIRASRGRDIAAACGQLRHEHPTTSQPE